MSCRLVVTGLAFGLTTPLVGLAAARGDIVDKHLTNCQDETLTSRLRAVGTSAGRADASSLAIAFPPREQNSRVSTQQLCHIPIADIEGLSGANSVTFRFTDGEVKTWRLAHLNYFDPNGVHTGDFVNNSELVANMLAERRKQASKPPSGNAGQPIAVTPVLPQNPSNTTEAGCKQTVSGASLYVYRNGGKSTCVFPMALVTSVGTNAQGLFVGSQSGTWTIPLSEVTNVRVAVNGQGPSFDAAHVGDAMSAYAYYKQHNTFPPAPVAQAPQAQSTCVYLPATADNQIELIRANGSNCRFPTSYLDQRVFSDDSVLTAMFVSGNIPLQPGHTPVKLSDFSQVMFRTGGRQFGPAAISMDLPARLRQFFVGPAAVPPPSGPPLGSGVRRAFDNSDIIGAHGYCSQYSDKVIVRADNANNSSNGPLYKPGQRLYIKEGDPGFNNPNGALMCRAEIVNVWVDEATVRR